MLPSQKNLVDNLDKIKGMGNSDVSKTVRDAVNKIESNEELSKKKKKENREATGSASAGPYAAPLFSNPSSEEIISPNSGKVPEVREDNGFKAPKLTMFSDEAKEYKIKKEEVLKGGLADNKTINDLAKKHKVDINTLTKELRTGIKTEMEHTTNKQKAKEIAMDHLAEDPKYYSKLTKMETKEGKKHISAKDIFKQDLQNDPDYHEFKRNRQYRDDQTGELRSLGVPRVDKDQFIDKKKYSRIKEGKSEKGINEKWSQKYKDSIDCNNPKGFSQKAHCQGKTKKSETKEATGAGSSGSYSQPSIWAKSTNKKDWAAARKTQIPGGQFVTVKKKCKKFPYCNQGDINAVKLWENETMIRVINNVSEKTGLSESQVKSIIYQELKNTGKLLD
jgi:hypothetical protein